MKRLRDDAGVTLVEVTVTMSIMAVVMLMFTGGVIQMYRSTHKNESIATAQAQTNIAFLRLDKEIRYATGISTPGLVGTDNYVEYLTTNTGTAVCTQLRLKVDAKQLQRRSWIQGALPGDFVPLASSVSSSAPFTLFQADATYNFQRLQLRLTATSGTGGTLTAAETDITFTALNTSLSTSSATVCTEGRAVL
jgi:prepilin-type N-terminal cleavage/methylation domain-containing protein